MNRATIAVAVLCLVCGGRLGAADSSLAGLSSTLGLMRGKELGTLGPRGASPQLTVAKHQLREWVESRLSGFPQDGEEGQLARALNAELREAKLSCEGRNCYEPNLIGFLEDLTLSRVNEFLFLKTRLGIECGDDESAYLYSWTGEAWHLFWESEQNNYGKDEYKPQYIEKVLVSREGPPNDYLILTLGREPWCSSNWHDVYYRVFRPGPKVNPEPILDGTEYAFLGNYRLIAGSVSGGEVLVEYSSNSLDSGVLIRTVVRNYSVREVQVARIDPIALSPRDFVDEWRAREWKEAVAWGERPNVKKLAALHKSLPDHGDFEPTVHCTDSPDLWQVGVAFENRKSPAYFLVRWRPPYQFRLVDILDRPRHGCSELDPAADKPQPTLFPL